MSDKLNVSSVLIQSRSGSVVHRIKQITRGFKRLQSLPLTKGAECLYHQVLPAVSVVSIESMSGVGLAGCITVNIVKV